MKLQRNLVKRVLFPVFGLLFALLTLVPAATPVHAEPSDPYAISPDSNSIPAETAEALEAEKAKKAEDLEAEKATEKSTQTAAKEEQDPCHAQVEGVAWLICPTTNFFAKVIDGIQSWFAEQFIKYLTVQPMAEQQEAPIFKIWSALRNISNVIFVIFILICVLSQVTTVGISNYGIKRMFPKLIVGAILVNVSWVLCLLLIDISNIVGASLYTFITNISNQAAEGGIAISATQLIGTLGVGGVIAGIAIVSMGGFMGTFIALLPVIVSALFAILSAFIMTFLRQAMIWLLLMVSPLAFACYLLPNTEKYFQKWKQSFSQMLFFFPMISALFGASQLIGWAVMATTGNPILGFAIQLFPLFYSFKLMKMSGTALGAIGGFLAGIGTHYTNRAKSELAPYQQATKLDRLAKNRAPSAKLQNYLNYRQALRDSKAEDDIKTIQSRARTRAYRKYVEGYDINKGTDQKLKANKYARSRRRAGNNEMNAAIASADADHVINNYGDFFTDKTREQLVNDSASQASTETGNPIQRIKARAAQKAASVDENLAKGAAHGWVEYNRAMFTKQSDEENDFDFLVGQYLGYMEKGVGSAEYNHYISSAAGFLGPRGATGIMGQLIAKADSVEQRKRRDDRILLAKYGFDKRQFRDMFIGYRTDDNGWAVDKDGNRVTWTDANGKKCGELLPGHAWQEHPEVLCYWDKYDEDGRAYFDWNDQKGHTIMRVYKDDSAMMKEMLSNSDVPINDPINMLYASMSSVDYGTVDPNDPSTFKNNVGIAKYSTTMGRAFLAAKYKEHASWGGPMYAEATSKRQIKNYAHNAIAMLDNIIKTNKPAGFLQQDAQNIDFLTTVLNPDNWDTIFSRENIAGLVNINNEPFTVKNGNTVIQNPTYEQIMGRLVEKYLYPAAQKMTDMVSKSSPRVIENQKTNVATALARLTEMLTEKWTDIEAETPAESPAGNQLKDPFVAATSSETMIRNLRTRSELHTRLDAREAAEAESAKATEALNEARRNGASADEIAQKEAAFRKANEKAREAQLRVAEIRYVIQREQERREKQAADYINGNPSDDFTYSIEDLAIDQDQKDAISRIYDENRGKDLNSFTNEIQSYLDNTPGFREVGDSFANNIGAFSSIEDAYNTLLEIIRGHFDDD